VTVHAVFAKQILVGLAIRQSVTVKQLAGVKCSGMALLAEERAPNGEQRWIDRTVWAVAQRAVLGCRLVLEDKRPAFLSVTLVTGIVQRGFDKLGHGG
jgi:hypothetical protein